MHYMPPPKPPMPLKPAHFERRAGSSELLHESCSNDPYAIWTPYGICGFGNPFNEDLNSYINGFAIDKKCIIGSVNLESFFESFYFIRGYVDINLTAFQLDDLCNYLNHIDSNDINYINLHPYQFYTYKAYREVDDHWSCQETNPCNGEHHNSAVAKAFAIVGAYYYLIRNNEEYKMHLRNALEESRSVKSSEYKLINILASAFAYSGLINYEVQSDKKQIVYNWAIKDLDKVKKEFNFSPDKAFFILKGAKQLGLHERILFHLLVPPCGYYGRTRYHFYLGYDY